MSEKRFDTLTRRVAGKRLLAVVAALVVGLMGRQAADAEVSQAYCGNRICASDPAVCRPGCVCCVYPNGNSRCRPPSQCVDPGVVAPAS